MVMDGIRDISKSMEKERSIVKISEKVSKYNWCYEWNKANPPSWTAKPLQVKELTQPTTYDANSNQIADTIHNLLDALPGKH